MSGIMRTGHCTQPSGKLMYKYRSLGRNESQPSNCRVCTNFLSNNFGSLGNLPIKRKWND